MAQRNCKDSGTDRFHRRTILRTGATLAALGVAGTTPTGAQTEGELPLEIEIYAEDEYIVVTNTGDEAVDLTGYSVNFEAPEDDYDQIEPLAGEVVIEAAASIVVPTGSASEVTSATGTIVELEEPYDTEVLNNEEPDDVAILDEEDNVVATTADSGGDGGGEEPGASLSVTVEDQDGNAVPGIEVVGIGPDADIFSTDANENGVATYDGLPAGEYAFHATVDGTDYEESGETGITLEDGDDETITVTVTDDDAGDETGDDTDDGDGDDGQPDDGGDDQDDQESDEGTQGDAGDDADDGSSDDCPKK